MDEHKYITHCKRCLKQFNRTAKQKNVCPKCIGKFRKVYTHKCLSCGKKTKKYNDFQFCSMECANKGKETYIFKKCLQCNKKMKVVSCRKDITQFCSRTCQFQHMRENSISDRINPTKLQYIEVMMKYAYKCGLCKAKHEFNYPLNLHHIDDNPRNTIVENLMPLCISCHRRVSIYNAKGKDGLQFVRAIICEKLGVQI